MTAMATTLPPPAPEQIQEALLRAIERTGVRFMVTPKRAPDAVPEQPPRRRRRSPAPRPS